MRKILISGASRGIGKAIALKLLKDGHSLSLGVRKKGDLINMHGRELNLLLKALIIKNK